MIQNLCYCDCCGKVAPLSVFRPYGKSMPRYKICIEDSGDQEWASNRTTMDLCENCYSSILKFINKRD